MPPFTPDSARSGDVGPDSVMDVTGSRLRSRFGRLGRLLALAQGDRESGLRGVWALSTALLLIAALALHLMSGIRDPLFEAPLEWWMLIPVFALVEVLVVHIDVQREAQTISLNEVPIVLGMFLVAPLELVLAQAIGAGLALAVFRRQTPVKLAFNLAQFAVVTCVAIGVFRALIAPLSGYGPTAWVAALIALLVADLISALLLSFVMLMMEGGSLPGVQHFVGFGTICTVANTALGLLAVSLLRDHGPDALLLIVPIGITILAYRGYWREHRRSEHLKFLYDSMRGLSSAPDLEQAVIELLRDARSVFRADVASAVLMPVEEGGPWRRSTLGPDDSRESLVNVDRRHWEGPVDEDARLVSARLSGEPYRCRLLGRDVRDAMSIPLHGEEQVIGTLVVADRASTINSFTAADLEFLKTFATHAGVALENRHLKRSIGELSRANDELFQQALHDPLTQLANRTLFDDRVEQALARREDGSLVGVLFIDLDDFKTINDTLGHAAGDRVLLAVAERLRACLRPGDTAARFGGDEFAVLLYDLVHPGEADAVCERILNALRAPVSAGDQTVSVRASIGVSVHPVGGVAKTLIDDADTAMYEAKRTGKGRWASHAMR